MPRLMTPALLVLLSASLAHAQPGAPAAACEMEMMKDPKLSLSDMFTKAEAKAKAWKPDVVVASITNTSLGPLDEQGKSEAWNLMFWSAAAKQQVNISTFRGMFNCYAMPGAPGRIPDLKPTFFRDGAKLYGLAKQNGGSFIAQGYTVSLSTAAAPSDRHATWYLNFSKNNTNAPLSVIVDANTGAVEKVIK
jgi:hypothetical protein